MNSKLMLMCCLIIFIGTLLSRTPKMSSALPVTNNIVSKDSNITFRHYVNNRTPFDCTRNIPQKFVDLRNNLTYNGPANNLDAGEAGRYSNVNHYYKPGLSAYTLQVGE